MERRFQKNHHPNANLALHQKARAGAAVKGWKSALPCLLVSLSMARTLRAAPSGLRIAIRLLTVALRRSIKRLQQTVAHTSKLVRPPAADPQPRCVQKMRSNSRHFLRKYG